MKKLWSVVLSLCVILLSLSPCFGVLAADLDTHIYEKKSAQIKEFSNDLNELFDEYDTEPEKLSVLSAVSETEEQSPVSEDGIYSYDDFETARLIVFSNEKFDIKGAVKHLNGYENMHVLQYETEEQAIEAYDYYCGNENIDFVEPDVIVTLNEAEPTDTALMPNSTVQTTSEIDWPHDTSIVPSWGCDRMQTYDAFQYILQHNSLENLPEIVVGIVDDGVGHGNPYLDARVLKTYTFLGSKGYPNTSLGNHGAGVAGVILENTLPNVKIISYQVSDSSRKSTVSIVSLGEEQARLDGVDIINSSYGYYRSQPSGMSDVTDRRANIEQPLHIAGSGNDSWTKILYPAALPNVISVACLAQDERLARYSNYGDGVDVAAPGDAVLVPCTGGTGKTRLFSGTSSATPFTVSVCAMIMTQYPTFSNEIVKEVLIKSCEESDVPVKYGIVNMFNAITYYDADARQTAAPEFSLESRPAPDKFYEETQYLELTCADENAEIYYTLDKTVPSKNNGTLYTEPIELSNAAAVWAVAYSDTAFKSEVAKRGFLIRIPLSDYPNENGWHIRDNGMIWGYSGPDMNLVVPETVLGIPVKGIEKSAFENQEYILSITMPECLEIIEDSAFYRCTELTSVIAPGVKTVGVSAFNQCRALDEVSIPKLETVGKSVFSRAGALNGFPFENLVRVPDGAFSNSKILKVDLQNAERVGSAFLNCQNLKEVYLPKIKDESLAIGAFMYCSMLEKVELPPNFKLLPERAFDSCAFEVIDFLPYIDAADARAFANNEGLYTVKMDALVYLGEYLFENDIRLRFAELPMAKYLDYGVFLNCSSLEELILSDDVEYVGSLTFSGCSNLKQLVINGNFTNENDTFDNSALERLEFNCVERLSGLPKTESCMIAMPSTFSECTEDTTGRNYKVYGTKGTNAEEWAKDNGHEFIEISQETALLKDVPMEYTSADEPLTVDVIGFNKTYQWYGNTVVDNTTGIPIDGATSKEFNPSDYDAYPYYYCVITSTDLGYEPVEIRTGVTENKSYSSFLMHYKEQIRFQKDENGKYNGYFDYRYLAKIPADKFLETFGDEQAAIKSIKDIGFVFTKNTVDFDEATAKSIVENNVAVDGYKKQPVYYLSTAYGDYVFSCIVTDIPDSEKNGSLNALAYVVYEKDGVTYYEYYDKTVSTSFAGLYNKNFTNAFQR